MISFFVFDTNSLISAALIPISTNRKALDNLITGEKDLLTLHPCRDIPILNAVGFINSF